MTIVLCIASGVCLIVAVFDEPDSFKDGRNAVVANAAVRCTALLVGGLLLAVAGVLGQ